ncbi:DUF2066 domain-containing protein [Magnetovibrio sp. PR-2]|uniref:DUF2066 domain-containing protein n=1 Tax=Magnetovibrio sp. PR-2 TaxID=3120356 RepID=UPI002FCE552A
MRYARALGLVFALILTLTNATAEAAAPRLFEVSNVVVDVTADSASNARVQALAKAEKIAFERLTKRLTLQAYHDRLPSLGAAQISELIQDFQVMEEKASSVRYIANLTYRFRAEQMRTLLNAEGIPFAETSSKPVLMLPVYQAAGALLLWDEPNPWRVAWNRQDEEGANQGLVPMVLPVGDLNDVRSIGAEQAIEGDMARLSEIARRYEAGDVVVAHGILRMDSFNGLPELEVYLTRFGSALQEHTVVKSFTSEPGDDVNTLLDRAVAQLTAQVEDNWKQDNLIQTGSAQLLPISVPVGNLGDWVRVRDRLNGVAVVQKMDLVLLRLDEVRVNLHFIGDAEQLALSLDQADLSLWEEAGHWYLAEKLPLSTASQ